MSVRVLDDLTEMEVRVLAVNLLNGMAGALCHGEVADVASFTKNVKRLGEFAAALNVHASAREAKVKHDAEGGMTQ